MCVIFLNFFSTFSFSSPSTTGDVEAHTIKTDLVKILVSVSFLSSKLGAQIQGCLLALHYLCLVIMMIMIIMVMVVIM